ncbi:ABC transporter substrate-binding protein [Brevundimonas aurifodinae]|uniref:ABC transporter substrate-binding protein n=2 Tax=Brevundimonas TaxID=41275 RepID=A0ABV1NNK7_9CAUL
MKTRTWALAAAVWTLTAPNAMAQAPTRILSLDQCADQYVLALAPDADLYLSPRADDPDSWMRAAAIGRPRVRPTLEAALAVRPEVVVRTWGGDPRLLWALESRGVRILQIGDAKEMADVQRNTQAAADALGRPDAGRRLVHRMERTLSLSAPSGEERGSALYMTAGGFTAGTGTLIDAILRAAGYANTAGIVGFGPISVERIAVAPPRRFVLGFFDQLRADWRGVGRHPVVRRASAGRVVADLPGAAITCPAWFAADAARMIATGTAR